MDPGIFHIMFRAGLMDCSCLMSSHQPTGSITSMITPPMQISAHIGTIYPWTPGQLGLSLPN